MSSLPAELADALDYIVLGGQRSPGVVTLRGHDRFIAWDIQKAEGEEGAVTKRKPDAPGSFEAEFYLAGDSLDEQGRTDFAQWDKFEAIVRSMADGPAPKALPIYHPDLARNGFTEVTSGGIGGLRYDSRGGALVIVKFQEYKPPKPKRLRRATPKAGVGAVVGTVTLEAPDPNAAAKAELSALLDQARVP